MHSYKQWLLGKVIYLKCIEAAALRKRYNYFNRYCKVLHQLALQFSYVLCVIYLFFKIKNVPKQHNDMVENKNKLTTEYGHHVMSH